MPVSYGKPKGSKFYLFNSIFGFSQKFSLNMNSFRKLYLIICKSLLFDPSSNDRLLIHNLCTFDVFQHFKDNIHVPLWQETNNSHGTVPR